MFPACNDLVQRFKVFGITRLRQFIIEYSAVPEVLEQ